MENNTVKASDTKPTKTRGRRLRTISKRKSATIGVVLLVVLLGAILWLNKWHRTSSGMNSVANVGIRKALSDTQSNVSVSNYQTYDEAVSAGDLYDTSLKYAQAYDAYKRALELTAHPNADVYVSLGRIAGLLHKDSEAKDYYKKALTAYDSSTLDSLQVQDIREKAGLQ